MEYGFIISTKDRKRPIKWALDRCKTKKQAYKRFQKMTGFFNLSFKDFLKTYIIKNY